MSKPKDKTVLKELTEEQKEIVLAERSRGKSIKEIAKILHVSDHRVSKYITPIEKEISKKQKGFDNLASSCCATAAEAFMNAEFAMRNLVEKIISTVSPNTVLTAKQQTSLYNSATLVIMKLADAIIGGSISSFVTMPADVKSEWMDNLHYTPKYKDPPFEKVNTPKETEVKKNQEA